MKETVNKLSFEEIQAQRFPSLDEPSFEEIQEQRFKAMPPVVTTARRTPMNEILRIRIESIERAQQQIQPEGEQ